MESTWPSVGLKVVMFNIISVKITIASYNFLKSSLKGGSSEPFEPPLPTPLEINVMISIYLILTKSDIANT